MNFPDVMSAVLLTGHGGPEKLEYRSDVPVPVPGDDEVLVKVGACGINNTDIRVREGAYGSSDDPEEVSGFGDNPLKFPRIQGADIVGKVVAAGSAIDASITGSRVLVDFGIYGSLDDDAAGINYIVHARDGGFAEYLAVPAENAHDRNSDSIAAPVYRKGARDQCLSNSIHTDLPLFN